MRLGGDLLEIRLAWAEGRLHEVTFSHKAETAICVVIAAGGYPGDYAKGMEISGLDKAEGVAPGSVKVFQAGTGISDGNLVSRGRRVLGVTALGTTLRDAQPLGSEACVEVRKDKSRYRKDIRQKALR